MKVLVIGSGGREHAICWALNKSNKVDKIYCSPGNAGTDKIAINAKIDVSNFRNLEKFIKKERIDLVIVGPEKPLVNGIVDFLEKKKIKVFGPNKYSSQLEGSKTFTKKICDKYNIPTAKFKIIKNKDNLSKILEIFSLPIVVKADGLAAGKGVYICYHKKDLRIAIDEIFKGKFGLAKKVLVEEYLDGEEMSFFIISDGKTFKVFGTAQDHKKVGEGDMGPNTGGMGSYSPSRLENKILEKKILAKIIQPTLRALKDKNKKFKGFLYAGLMIVKNEPYLIEYNVRMGDPECQTILPRLKTDFFEIINSCINNNLEKIDIKWSSKKSLCIVLCAKGYPGNYKSLNHIKNLKKILTKKNEFIFHAGTKIKSKDVISNGGRVLNFTALSESFKLSRDRVIRLIKKLNWKNGFFRKDIGFRVIDK